MSPTSEEKGARVRFPPPLVFLLAIVAGILLQYWVPLSPSIARPLRLALGVALLIAGFGPGMTANVIMRRSGQSPKPWTPSPSLLLSGPYLYSRNPMYVGMVLLQAGIGVLANNFWIVILALPALAVVHYTAVLREEAYLQEKFGEAYRQYTMQVRRYL